MTTVMVRNTATGVLEEALAPYGNGCVGCRGGTKRGVPYMEWGDVCRACSESHTFRSSCINMSNIHTGEAPPPELSGMDTVFMSEALQDQVRARYGGWLESQFSQAHNGITPSEAGITGYYENHPLTGAELEVYWVQSTPALELVVSKSQGVRHSINQMPDQLYANQPSDTVEYWTRKLPTSLRASDARPPPSESEVVQQVTKLCQQRGKSIPSFAHFAICSGSGNAVGAASMRQPGGSMSLRPPVPSFSPLGSGASAGAAASLPPGTITAALAPSSMGSVHSGARVSPKQTLVVAKPALVTPPPQPHAASVQRPPATPAPPNPLAPLAARLVNVGARRPAAGVPSPGPPKAKTARFSPKTDAKVPGTGLRLTASALAKLNSGGLSASPRVPKTCPALAFVDEDDGQSAVPSELRHLEPTQRCIETNPLRSALLGKNQKDALTKVQRRLSYCEAREMGEDVRALQSHQTSLVAGQELHMDRLVLNPLENIPKFVDVLVPAIIGELPKRNIAEIACRYAYAHIFHRPLPLVKWEKLYEHLDLYSTAEKKPLNFKHTVLWSQCFDEDDLTFGVAAKTFITFLEKYLFSPVLASSDAKSRSRLSEYSDKVLTRIGGWPEQYYEGELRDFRVRLKGLVWLAGATPCEHESSIQDVEALSRSSSVLSVNAKQSPWVSSLLRESWMLSASEGPVWKDVAACSASLKSNDTGVQDVALQKVASEYVSWKLAVRVTFLPVAIHGPAETLLNRRVDACQIAGKAVEELDPDDSVLLALLKHVRAVGVLWASQETKMMAAKFKHFGTAVSIKNNYSAFLAATEAVLELGELESAEAEKASSCLSALKQATPESPDVLLISTAEHKPNVVEVLFRLVSWCTRRWPGEGALTGIQVLASKTAKGVEINEPATMEHGDVEKFNVTVELLKMFEDLGQLRQCIAEYEGTGSNVQERVENKESLNKIKDMLSKNSALTVESFSEKAQQYCNTESIKSLISESHAHLLEYRFNFVLQGELVLHNARDELRGLAGGCNEPGTDWKEVADKKGGPFQTFADLQARTAQTLQCVDRISLLKAIRNVRQAASH